MRNRWSAEALRDLEGIFSIKSGAQTKHDLPRLAVQQLERNSDSATGIKPCAYAAGEILRCHRSGIRQSAIAADKFRSVACDTASHRRLHRKKQHGWKTRCCMDCAQTELRFRVRFRSRHAFCFSQAGHPVPIRRNPLPKACETVRIHYALSVPQTSPARPARHRTRALNEFHFGVLENTVTESMPGNIWRLAPGFGRGVGDQKQPVSSSRKIICLAPESQTGSLFHGVNRNSWAFSYQVYAWPLSEIIVPNCGFARIFDQGTGVV